MPRLFFLDCDVLTHSTPLLQKPQKLRHMLEQQAPLGRLYLAPEGKNRRQQSIISAHLQLLLLLS
jgi:hypothetical protein